MDFVIGQQLTNKPSQIASYEDAAIPLWPILVAPRPASNYSGTTSQPCRAIFAGTPSTSIRFLFTNRRRQMSRPSA